MKTDSKIDWRLKSVFWGLLGIVFLVESHIGVTRVWSQSMVDIFAVVGIVLIMIALLHFSLNTIVIELTKGKAREK